jgi:hypothetical protein
MVKPQSWMSRRLPAVIVLFAAAAIVKAPVEVVSLNSWRTTPRHALSSGLLQTTWFFLQVAADWMC